MSCPDRDRLASLAHGGVSRDEINRLTAHVVVCARCQRLLTELDEAADADARLYLPSESLVHATLSGNGSEAWRARASGATGECFDDAELDEMAAAVGPLDLDESQLDHLVACSACQIAFESVVLASQSAAVDYMPSDVLVARVLVGSRRPAPHFRMPAHLMTRRGMEGGGTSAAAAVLAALEVSPGALAAATVSHVAVFALVGIWIASGVLGAPTSPNRILAQPNATEQLTYYVTRASPSAYRREVNNRRAELAKALSLELVFEGDRNGLREQDRAELQRIAQILVDNPSVVVRLTADDVTIGDGRAAMRLGARDAETVVRWLGERGIAGTRIHVVFSDTASSGCRPDERECRMRRRLVRLSVERFDPPR